MARGKNDLLRTPPHATESEKAFLGALMIRSEAMIESVDVISSDAFYSEKHRIIYRAVLALYSKNEPVDIESVRAKLADLGELESIGGIGYLAELVSEVPAASNARHYASQVQKKYMLRSLIDAGEYVAELGFEEAEDLDETLDKAEKKIYEVTSTPTLTKFVSLRESLADAWQRLEHLTEHKDEMRGIRTGFKDLDNMLAGLQKSDLIILAARPSMGKTALALDIARQTAIQHNNVVGIFSLEMSSQQLIDRMVAAEARVNSWNLRTGRITDKEDFERLRDAYDRLSAAPIYIDDQPGTNILKMRSVARRLKREHGLGLIVVDYLQLMVPTGARASDSLVQQVTELSRSLKTLARELDVPVLALSQLSRAVEQRRGKPRLSDLRDSGSIEQDADVVMFIHREDRMNDAAEKNNIAEILIEKHRNGPVGKVDLYFDEKRTTFQTLEKTDFGAFESAAQDFSKMNPIERLTQLFEHFPGIGPRQARRFVQYLLTAGASSRGEISDLIKKLGVETAQCKKCFRWFVGKTSECNICSNPQRDNSILFIVEKDADIENVERSNYKGLYFVLGGTIPLASETPAKHIRLNELQKRVTSNSLKEIILGLSATTEGDHTRLILQEKLKDSGIKLSSLGRGLSTGSELEYADPDTIASALSSRQ
ncbi:replicative DNA helicase [Candidatus Parcubacteria bacterium]|nr:replicative DNA helicase [Candidatus Parcubacteria bacterium]